MYVFQSWYSYCQLNLYTNNYTIRNCVNAPKLTKEMDEDEEKTTSFRQSYVHQVCRGQKMQFLMNQMDSNSTTAKAKQGNRRRKQVKNRWRRKKKQQSIIFMFFPLLSDA